MDRQVKSISIGLIRHLGDEGWRWLARWDSRKRHFDFITADCLEGESPREAISREVAWALDLNRGRDILVCNMAQSNLEFVERFPGDQHETIVKIAFYNVELYRKGAVAVVNAVSENAWMTSQEICEGKTKENLPLNPFLTQLVSKSGVIQHWESST